MLVDMFPRAHARYESLRVVGPHLDGLVVWLVAQGYPRLPIRRRVRAARSLDAELRRNGIRKLGDLSAEELLGYAPVSSQDDIYRSALVRSLGQFLEAQGVLVTGPSTPALDLAASYRVYLESSRGLAAWTVKHHLATVRDLLAHIGTDRLEDRLRGLDAQILEGFVQRKGKSLGRESLQHTVAQLRSFLRFLAMRGLVSRGLNDQIDTPRVYRGERLPRALPWESVCAFIRAIDRSTPMGRRDFAMFMLIATYGLRTCEVASLTLDDIKWRAREIRVPRAKVLSPLLLPLTTEVGAAILAYLRDGRPALQQREIFLRVRAPAGKLKPTAVTEAFQGWVRRAGLSIPFQGPHCLRHSLAIHLLRQGTPLKTIGDLLGHRSVESTCVYLRLDVEDLRDVALDLPEAARQKARA